MADNVPIPNEEVQHSNLKTSIIKSIGGIATLPIHVVKTLMQLGWEPFPCETGKVYIFFGNSAYFLPNGFMYIYKIAKRDGCRVLFKGLDCFVLFNFTNEYVRSSVNNYLDIEYPNLGGELHPRADDFIKLNDKEAFAVSFRNFVRDMVSHNTAVVVSRPFLVLFVRQIAQIIGNENKYTNVIRDIYTIGSEEGLKGFFSGLTAAIVATSTTVTLSHLFSFILERSLLKFQQNDNETEEENITKIKRTRSVLGNVIPIICNSWSYRYQLVSSIMAVSGSQLACSLLPYTPQFNHYEDFIDYLKPNGSISRGSKLFLRQYKGPISIKNVNEVYANTGYIS
uniref:Mitochondrial carrier homolog 2 (inferred by orthology to a zebrafish protein) n=1 Tax=Strongyloides venezuelensis TaxID=75913 RepID=A0A0K0FYM8_STRVS